MSRRSDQRRAAVFALYQHDLTGRGLDDVFERDASTFTRALAYAADDYVEDLDALIERHAHGWTLDRIAPLEKAIMRIALLEMLHPDVAPGRPADPAGGRDRRGRRDRQDLLRRRRARLRQRHPGGGAPRDARECRHLMTDLDTTTLDTLVERLERAAEQLRTGDLSPDAAAGLVEDCAALAVAGLGRARAHGARERQEPAPGQDSLLASQDTLL